MNRYRTAISADEKKFLKLVKAIDMDTYDLEGDFYKRNRYMGTNKKIPDWYNRKDFCLISNHENVSDIADIFDYDLIKQKLIDGFLNLKDFYRFMKSAVADNS